MTQTASALTRISEILNRLLDPESGCPWDRKQTPHTLKTYLLEEIYELLEAIEGKDTSAIKDELGDCFFLLAFISRLFEAGGQFDLEEALDAAAEKIIRRHPHVFGETPPLSGADEVKEKWHELKQKEKRTGNYLASVPRSLPALMRAHRLSERAGRMGFDWSEPVKVLETLEKEMAELKDALTQQVQSRISSELGDLLFTLANLARHLNVNGEEALQAANSRFENRFNYIEKKLAARGQSLAEATLAEMDRLWVEAKAKGL
ncbi:MAG: nucleoside triphosphate pyrophosphohydrolase [Deltaproteobacteria bacterium]|nr:nucleoside triphosphate pyrophosphohydrolase [Deltaproteobacteria bacterium]